MNMRFNHVLSFLLLLGVSTVSRAQTEGALHGAITDDGVYISPTGAFRIPVPVLPELGGSVEDTDYVVTFQDEVNTHITVACFPMDATGKWNYETNSPKDFLTAFFKQYIESDLERNYPGASVDGVILLPKFNGGALVVYNLLPGGSMFQDKITITGAEALPPAKRGNMVFVKNDHVFIISTELAERILQSSTYKKTTEEENEILKNRLVDIAGKIKFTEPKK